MSKVEYGSITFASTGNKICILNDDTIQIESIVVFVVSSTSECSAGFSDLTNTYTGSNTYNDENLTHSITHYRNIGGVKTKVFEGTVTDFSTVGEFIINITTLSEATQLKFVAFGN